MYMIMALSEKAEIEYVIESGDDERPKEMSPSKQLSNINQGINEFDKLRNQSTQKVSAQVIPQDIQQMIEETELPSSLLDQVKSNTTPSLLNKEEK